MGRLETTNHKTETAVMVHKRKDVHFKQKFEFRQKNLTCPHGHYHMKVQFRDLEHSRPSCPVCNAPMLVKEELREVKQGKLHVDKVVEVSDLTAYLC